MKDKVIKNRKHVDWYALRLELGDPDVESYYWLHFKALSRFDFETGKKIEPKNISLNRKSYWALLHVYGKKRLDAYRVTGVWQ